MQINLKDGKATWKQGWEEVGGKRHYFKSKWEYRYALYLELMKTNNYITDWWYEPQTFYFQGIKRGTTNYKPDFKVLFPSGKHEWFEIKGYETAKDRTKYKRMAKYHPQETLRVVGKEWFKENSRKLSAIIKDWK